MIKQPRLVVIKKKVAMQFDDEFGKLKGAKEIGTTL